MSFTRAAFVLVLLTPVLGFLGARYLISSVFGQAPIQAYAPGPTAGGTPTRTPAPTASPTPPIDATATIPPIPTPTRQPHLTPTPRASMTPTPQAIPSPTAGTGTVTLARYWIGSVQARRGTTIAVGYVVDNETGRAQRVMLGASIKSSRALSWLTATISDPEHDAVALVPPGLSTHSRFFTLPARLRPGTYDVAWGLRDAATGQRQAVVFAPAALSVGG